MENLGHHLVVLAAEHEGAGRCCGVGEHCETFGIDDEHLVAVPVFYLDVIFADELIFGAVGAQGEGLLIVEWFCSHNILCFL